MSAKKNVVDATATTLVDDSVPWEHRKLMIGQLCLDGSPESDQIMKSLLAAAAKGNGESLFAKKAKEAAELVEELKRGALRPATYIGPIQASGSSVRRAQVMLSGGESAYPVVADEKLAALECGDTVLVDAQVRAVLDQDPNDVRVGEEATLERRLDKDRVRVVVRDHDAFVFRVSAALAAKLDRGQVVPGSKLLVCSRRAMAFDAVPPADGLSHYRYLVRESVPDVVVERDIGSPPEFIEELMEHLRREMLAPDLGRRYHQRRAVTKLLTGVSGSGKTYGIRGLWRKTYELMSQITAVPIDQLPPRVFRLRMSQVLVKWLGDSDKNIDRFFDEVEQLAGEPYLAPDGTPFELPVLAICEEIDGLARARGGEAVYDRIQTTALERLDMNCQRLSSRLVVLVFTTNVPHLVDPAFLRRAGGTIERFGRLGRRSFAAVLEKHLSGLPFVDQCGRDQRARERRALCDVTDWLFSPNGHDPGQVELTYVGSGSPVVFHRRAFLTAGLVDRAVQQAAAEACRAERLGCDPPGLASRHLIAAFDRQIRSLVEQLTEYNAPNYLTLPDGVRVGNVRRIEQPPIEPYELERTLP